jgi:rapamycin-insensitive companion of mTOR
MHGATSIILTSSSLKAKKPEAFQQIGLFQKTLTLLESHHFRLYARRFALDLFDKSIMSRIVLEEESEPESGEPSPT